MILSELIQRSPIRVFEQSFHGGLKAGEIGVITSQAGIGKTSVLVQIALDKLLQGKKVIHVSFTPHTHYVLAWYEDIFNEFINKKNLENAGDVKNDLVKNRVLMNFSQDGISKDLISKSLRAMIVEGGFAAEAIIVDGFNFSRSSRDQIAGIRELAGTLGLSIWYSCTVEDESWQNKANTPPALKDITDLVDVVIALNPKQSHIELSVVKDRDNSNTRTTTIRLDPKTLLIRNEE